VASNFPKIIGIVGPIRAGKTTASKYLVERYGYIPASNSDFLGCILKGMGLLPTRTNLASLGDSIFKVMGNDIIAKHRLDNLELGRIVVDGIRYPDELKRYSEVLGFKLLGITADPTIRFERTIRESTEIKDMNISQAEFDCLSQTRSELSVPELVSQADAIICNLDSINSLMCEIDKIMLKWSL
jgi:dephospho-CoA kinase